MLREMLSGKSESEEHSTERNTAKGILCENEDAMEGFQEDKDRFFAELTVDELEELSDLDSFVDSYRHSQALNFAKSWSRDVECFVEIRDAEEFEVELSQLYFTGEITNKVIQSFGRHFRSNIYTTFDPMAEEHEEPHLSVEPW